MRLRLTLNALPPHRARLRSYADMIKARSVAYALTMLPALFASSSIYTMSCSTRLPTWAVRSDNRAYPGCHARRTPTEHRLRFVLDFDCAAEPRAYASVAATLGDIEPDTRHVVA
jgi:hypothetical protein